MNQRFNKGAQGGFTLIELIVVIVILGILAATALPKFASLSGDARKASLQAARGAMTSSAAMVHGKWLISGGTSINVEGTAVGITEGYPTADAKFAEAAGLGANDYDIDAATTGTIKITPKGLSDTLKATCFVSYTNATKGNVPTYNQPATFTCE